MTPGSLYLAAAGVNAAVRYSIVSGDDLGWFRIDERTGLLTTQRRLDHERRAAATLRVEARDGGGYTARTNVTVTVQDENDEVPRFERETWSVELSEGEPPGTCACVGCGVRA